MVSRYSNGGTIYLHVFDGGLSGPGIGYGDGKRDRDVTTGWTRVESGVDWNVRLAQRARYRVALDYATSRSDSSGAFVLTFGDEKLTGRVQPTANATTFTSQVVGDVTLGAGEFTIGVRATEIASGELMRLRRITLTPLKEE